MTVDAPEEGVRGVDGGTRVKHFVGEAPEILDERELQHARPRPELADGERGDALKAVEKQRQLLNIKPAVAVPEQLYGNRVNASVARVLSNSKRWQFAIVGARKVLTDVDDVGRDEMKVVEKPFRRGRNEEALVHIVGKSAVRGAYGAGVVVEAWKDASSAPAGRGVDRESRRQRQRAFFEPLDAEQLVSKRPQAAGRRAVPDRCEQSWPPIRALVRAESRTQESGELQYICCIVRWLQRI